MNKMDLGGTWKFRKAGSQKWMTAKVPGVVHLDLMKNGIITDPFNRDNEPLQQWVGETGWEYEKSFFISDTLFVRKSVDLVCKGLDTYANVSLPTTCSGPGMHR
jgi:beta-mannosidase